MDKTVDWIADAHGVAQLRTPRSILDLVNYQLHLVGTVSSSNITRICEGEFGITRREWRFLALLAACGGMAPSELADRAGLDRSRTSKALMPLLEKGLIERSSLRGDGRRASVELTAEGRRLYERMFPRVAAVNAALLDTLDESEIALLARVLNLLRRRAVEIAQSDLVLARADRRHGGSRRRWAGQNTDSD